MRAKEESGNRLRMFLLSVALIMIKMRRLHISFMQWCRINSIMQFRDRQQREIVYYSADHIKDHMGLTTWKNAPDGRVLKSDVTIAKNYLDEKQIRSLERAVTGYFDYIEDLIERENTFTMEEFAASINEFLAFRRYEILPDRGKISRKMANDKAEQE